MREHGVLRRVLLVYEEIARRATASEAVPVGLLSAAAGLVRRFVEDYHEKMEEEYVFPRFEKAGYLVELVAVLRAQHHAGRVVTDRIRALAALAPAPNAATRREIAAAVGAFSRMYRPHAAREDTVLFPALRGLLSPADFADLGERFEDIEHRFFGTHGFDGAVAQAADFEKALGIFDLAQFTPPA